MNHLLRILPSALALSATSALASVSLSTPAGVTLNAGTEYLGTYVVDNLNNNSGLSGAADVYNYNAITHGGASPANAWVTDAPNGPTGDYYDNGTPVPQMTFDLGSVRHVSDLVLWGYAPGGGANNNEARNFTLEFSTDGVTYGAPVNVSHLRTATQSQTVPLGGVFQGQYVRMTITDNYQGAAGAAGGDRVGLGEVKFITTDTATEIYGAGTPYAYITSAPYATPGFSGGTFYFDDTHDATLTNFSAGDLTDGLTMPDGVAPTVGPDNTLVGYDPFDDQGAIVFDLGSSKTVETVRIGTHNWTPFANGTPDGVELLFSDDNVTFAGSVTAAFDTVNYDAHHDFFVDAGGATGRYVQVRFDGGAISGGASNKYLLDEITIYAVPEPGAGLLAALVFAMALSRRRR